MNTRTHAVLCFIVAALLLATSQAAISRKQPNSLGVVIFDDNPNTYMFGLPVDGVVVNCSKNEVCTNISFRPYNTDMLHTESVLFCGNEVESFKGKHGALVVTYRRQGTRNYKGISCHDLQSVFEVNADSPEKF